MGLTSSIPHSRSWQWWSRKVWAPVVCNGFLAPSIFGSQSAQSLRLGVWLLPTALALCIRASSVWSYVGKAGGLFSSRLMGTEASRGLPGKGIFPIALLSPFTVPSVSRFLSFWRGTEGQMYILWAELEAMLSCIPQRQINHWKTPSPDHCTWPYYFSLKRRLVF